MSAGRLQSVTRIAQIRSTGTVVCSKRGILEDVVEEHRILFAAPQKSVDFVRGIQHFLSLDGAVLPVAIDNALSLDAGWIADALFVARVGCDAAGIAPKAVNWREIRSRQEESQHQQRQRDGHTSTDGDRK